MKITKSTLKQIIKEEYSRLVSEAGGYNREKGDLGYAGDYKRAAQQTPQRSLKTIEGVQTAFNRAAGAKGIQINDPARNEFQSHPEYGVTATNSPSSRYMNRKPVTRDEIQNQLEFLSNMVKKYDPAFVTPQLNTAFDPMKGVEQK